jgi:malonate-semialdehyde dehydrogenase (acetylating)/methylmalonate-semialdehyde dehydrogenase
MQTTITTETLKNFIGGQWVSAQTERSIDVPNPATGETLAYVPLSTREDLDKAVEAAKEAFKIWSKTAVPRRARILFRYQQLLVEHWEGLARLITMENGKSYEEAYGEVQRGIECVEFAAGAPTLMMGSQLPDIATEIESGMYRYPIGVVGGITPFNFPMMVPCWMFPLAIACGNTFVLKPSERTPLLANRLAELFTEAGLPDGVLNIVHGAHDIVNGILEHPGIKAVSFVGSQPVAEYVYKTAAANGKRVQALAGAKNHSIVMPDADLDLAVKNIIGAAFGSAGERCMACAVVVAVGDIADKLVDRLKEEADNIKIGNGLEEGVFLGPVIRDSHKDRTLGYIEAGEQEGAQLVRDGREDDAVNGACLYTDSAKAVRQFRDEIDAGMLGVNVGVPAPMAFFPFSGYKKSFYGDLHANGRDGVEFYTRKKMLTARY